MCLANGSKQTVNSTKASFLTFSSTLSMRKLLSIWALMLKSMLRISTRSCRRTRRRGPRSPRSVAPVKTQHQRTRSSTICGRSSSRNGSNESLTRSSGEISSNCSLSRWRSAQTSTCGLTTVTKTTQMASTIPRPSVEPPRSTRDTLRTRAEQTLYPGGAPSAGRRHRQ